jgi:hypothetical protein
MSIEQFAADHRNTIAAVEAVSTLGAVLFSLAATWLAQRSKRTHLHASVTKTQIVQAGEAPQDRPRYISVDIVNDGDFALRLPFSFFSWRIPFSGEFATVNPHDYYGIDAILPAVPYPVEIAPRASHKANVSNLATFRETMMEMMEGIKWFPRLRLRFIQAYVVTEDRGIFKAQLTKNNRDELEQLRKQLLEKRAR